jgi:hypothetical protein
MAGVHGPQRNADKERFWRGCLARWRGSRLSVREFCRREALSEPSFYAWRRELARREASQPLPRPASRRRPRQTRKPAAFVPVHVVAPRSTGSSIEIVLPGGRRVRVRPGFDRVTLEAVLELLERRPC